MAADPILLCLKYLCTPQEKCKALPQNPQKNLCWSRATILSITCTANNLIYNLIKENKMKTGYFFLPITHQEQKKRKKGEKERGSSITNASRKTKKRVLPKPGLRYGCQTGLALYLRLMY